MKNPTPKEIEIGHITHELLLQFALLVNEGMRRRRKSVKDLSIDSKVPVKVIEQVLHAQLNVDIDAVASLLLPLDMVASLQAHKLVDADPIKHPDYNNEPTP